MSCRNRDMLLVLICTAFDSADSMAVLYSLIKSWICLGIVVSSDDFSQSPRRPACPGGGTKIPMKTHKRQQEETFIVAIQLQDCRHAKTDLKKNAWYYAWMKTNQTRGDSFAVDIYSCEASSSEHYFLDTMTSNTPRSLCFGTQARRFITHLSWSKETETASSICGRLAVEETISTEWEHKSIVLARIFRSSVNR